ncbi:ABC transporter permease [Clostridium gasigenes]|uniref:ABC transporter permease n=1 Tax=Clostridium gasigenes TaxID=94869 RepID=UPI001C0CBC43|nr:ABC transporter permease [Clostridium gasigenes]MBU3133398.1 ABC transporter permease [Clostridium gasigenes]
MGSFMNILFSNLKRMLKNKGSLAATFIAPVVVIFGLSVFFNSISASSSKTYNIVNLDNKSYSEELVESLIEKYTIKIYSKEEAIEKLKAKKISEFYEIQSNFTDEIKSLNKPEIIVNRRESSADFSDFNMVLNDTTNNMVIREELQIKLDKTIELKELVNDKDNLTIVAKDNNFVSKLILGMLLSFVMFASIGMCYELFYLKKLGTLRRSLITGNSSFVIIGAVLMAQFIIIAVGYYIIFIVNVVINVPDLKADIPIILLNISTLTLVALSFAVFITRIVKNEALIAVVTQGVIGLTCFIGGTFIPIEMLPEKLATISKFTPQYWALESINTGKWEYTLIVLLFALVLFTAGTVSSKSFSEI